MIYKSSIVSELRQVILAAERAGMTRYRLSKLSGVEQAVLSKIIHKKRVVRIETAAAICAALGKRLAIVDGKER